MNKACDRFDCDYLKGAVQKKMSMFVHELSGLSQGWNFEKWMTNMDGVK